MSSAHDLMQRFMEDLAVNTRSSSSTATVRSLQDLARSASVVQMIARDDTCTAAIALQGGGEKLVASFLDPPLIDNWRISPPSERERFAPYVEFSDMLDVFLVTGKHDIDKT